MKEFENLLKHVKDLEEDFTKFYDKNNKAAGTRIRKGMLELKQISHRIRLEVQNRKNESASAPCQVQIVGHRGPLSSRRL